MTCCEICLKRDVGIPVLKNGHNYIVDSYNNGHHISVYVPENPGRWVKLCSVEPWPSKTKDGCIGCGQIQKTELMSHDDFVEFDRAIDAINKARLIAMEQLSIHENSTMCYVDVWGIGGMDVDELLLTLNQESEEYEASFVVRDTCFVVPTGIMPINVKVESDDHRIMQMSIFCNGELKIRKTFIYVGIYKQENFLGSAILPQNSTCKVVVTGSAIPHSIKLLGCVLGPTGKMIAR